MDQFDAFFRQADLDRDGRISGAEAVAFFQGSGLPRPVLAKRLLPTTETPKCVGVRLSMVGSSYIINTNKNRQNRRRLAAMVSEVILFRRLGLFSVIPAFRQVPTSQVLAVVSNSQVRASRHGFNKLYMSFSLLLEPSAAFR